MQGGFICKKKEMTRIMVDANMTAVTIVEVPKQEIVSYKTQEKDGYDAVVVGVGKKEFTNKNGKKLVKYRILKEFRVDKGWMENHQVGEILVPGEDLVNTLITVSGVSKGKGYQGAMKRCNVHGGPKTHGSKFHRQVGSMGNRKPRRTMKGHPHAGHMGGERITLHKVPVVRLFTIENSVFLALKGSLPGAYNSIVYVQKK